MKNLLLLTLSIVLIGCAPADKYDLATEKQRSSGAQLAAPKMVDANEIALPDGANVEEVKIRKGEKLPDGKIATEDTTIKSFSMPMGDGKIELSSQLPKKK